MVLFTYRLPQTDNISIQIRCPFLSVAGSEDGNGTIVIVQHFRPGAFFTQAQQIRLQELMEQFHTAGYE